MRAKLASLLSERLNKSDTPTVIFDSSLEDAGRGVVSGARGGRLLRYAPSERASDVAQWYWHVTWDLDAPHEVKTLPFPSLMLTLEAGRVVVHGPRTRVFVRTLSGRGEVLGVRFTPAGGRAIARVPLQDLVDERASLEVLRLRLRGDEGVDELDAALATAPREPHAYGALTERAIARLEKDPSLQSVRALADELGLSERALQRHFREVIGLSPKRVMRRYRLQEAALRARAFDVDWSQLALELGYADQAHLIRDVRSTFGTSPGRF